MKSKQTLPSFITVAAIVLSFSAAAQAPGHQGHQGHKGPPPMGGVQASPYTGQEKRAIKSLSARDIDDLINGRGWGFAKAAELNGLPGPVHILELKDKIGLSLAQTAAVEKLFAGMKERAVPLGKRLVSLERSLNDAFAGRSIDENRLREMLNEVGKVRSELRYVHLATHLKTPAVLSPKQVDDYNRLRGYAASAPTAGHPR